MTTLEPRVLSTTYALTLDSKTIAIINQKLNKVSDEMIRKHAIRFWADAIGAHYEMRYVILQSEDNEYRHKAIGASGARDPLAPMITRAGRRRTGISNRSIGPYRPKLRP